MSSAGQCEDASPIDVAKSGVPLTNYHAHPSANLQERRRYDVLKNYWKGLQEKFVWKG